MHTHRHTQTHIYIYIYLVQEKISIDAMYIGSISLSLNGLLLLILNALCIFVFSNPQIDSIFYLEDSYPFIMEKDYCKVNLEYQRCTFSKSNVYLQISRVHYNSYKYTFYQKCCMIQLKYTIY